MRYPAAEKLEIIRLVEQSHLPVRRTLAKIGIPPTTFYRWYDRFVEHGPEGLEDRSSSPSRVWNRIPEAVADLQVWNKSHLAPTVLTESIIRSFYTPTKTLFVKTLNAGKMSSSFVVTAQQEPLIHCVLHFRRIETMFDGYRWFDIKRYGIEINHAIGRTVVKTLVYNDVRRAIQLPQEVVSAGELPNPLSEIPASTFQLFVEPTQPN